jgi:hypothetical protein
MAALPDPFTCRLVIAAPATRGLVSTQAFSRVSAERLRSTIRREVGSSMVAMMPFAAATMA